MKWCEVKSIQALQKEETLPEGFDSWSDEWSLYPQKELDFITSFLAAFRV